jgi:hypothetical protein
MLFEIVTLLVHPVDGQRVPLLFQGNSLQPKALSGVGEIENPQGIPPVEINESLEPFGSIGDGTDLLCLHDPSSLGLHLRQFGERGGIGHAREVRKGVGPHLVLE